MNSPIPERDVIKLRIDEVLNELNKDNPDGFEIPLDRLYSNCRLYFGDWGGGIVRRLVRKIAKVITWPFFKQQVAYNEAVRASLENLYGLNLMLFERLKKLEAVQTSTAKSEYSNDQGHD